MTKLKLSDTSKALVFLMVLSSDKSTGATGLSPTVTLSKNGGSFNACTGTVTEIANGWYKLVPSAADVGTLGPLALHATGTAAEPKDKEYQVVAFDPYSATDGGLQYLSDCRSTLINATSVTDQTAFVGATDTLFQFSSSSLPTSAANGGLKGKIFSIISGTGAGQDRVIINASFGVYFTLTMDAAFTVTPDATSVWIIRRDRLAKLDSSLRPSVLDSNGADFDATAIEVDGAAVAAAVWTNASRTLTANAPEVIETQQFEERTLVQGNSYSATARDFTFTKATDAAWPTTLSEWTWSLTAEAIAGNDADTQSFTGSVSVLVDTGASQQFRVTILKTATATALGRYEFVIHGEKAGEDWDAVIGTLLVRASAH